MPTPNALSDDLRARLRQRVEGAIPTTGRAEARLASLGFGVVGDPASWNASRRR